MPRYLLSQNLKTALQHMPFGPSHCCALNKGTDHKRAMSIWATKGKWDEREGNLSRIGNNGIVENREQRHRRLLKRGSSALLPPKLVSPDPLEFLRPKGYIVLPRVQIVRDYRNYVVWISFYDLGSHLQRWLSKLCCVQIMFSVNIIELGNKRGKP